MNGMVCESVRFPSLTNSLSVSDAKEKCNALRDLIPFVQF